MKAGPFLFLVFLGSIATDIDYCRESGKLFDECGILTFTGMTMSWDIGSTSQDHALKKKGRNLLRPLFILLNGLMCAQGFGAAFGQ